MNIFSKTNKDIAAIAAKVMAEQPAKVNEYKPAAPIQSNLVDQVVKAGVNTKFSKNNLKEDKVLWNAMEDDHSTDQNKTVQKAKLDHEPKWPKAKPPLEHTKSTNSSAEDGTMSMKSVTPQKESIDAGLTNNGQANMKGVYVSGKKKAVSENEEPPFEGGHKVPEKHTDQFGNLIKPENLAKHLAKKGLASVLAKRKKGK